MLSISIKSKHFNCSFDLRKKITVIQGFSGTGKTRLCEALADTSGAYTVTISDSSYVPLQVPNREWYAFIDDNITSERKRIFILDDVSYVATKEFSEIFSREKYSFFILITRHSSLNSWNQLPFCMNEIYTLEGKGADHWLKPVFSADANLTSHSMYITVTEDSNSGYQYFKTLMPQTFSLEGRDNIEQELGKYGSNILLLVDQAAMGAKCSILHALAIQNSQVIYLPRNYFSFEYMLSQSNLLSGLIPIVTNEMICAYSSHEKLYTAILESITKDAPYRYGKSKLNTCYTEDCCRKNQGKTQCKRGLQGKKSEKLFSNTSWEQLIRLLKFEHSEVLCFSFNNGDRAYSDGESSYFA